MHWYLIALCKYADFEGRAHRTEYWTFYLGTLVLIVALSLSPVLVLELPGEGGGRGPSVLGGIALGASLLPLISATVRRLHDSGRSGFWIFVKAVPLVGFLVLLAFLLQDSQPGANAYGPNPKGAPALSAGEASDE